MGISGSQDNNEKKPVVLILGGGYGELIRSSSSIELSISISTLAGIECAKTLDKTGQFFVVLIDRKSYFLHNIAALRATVEPEFAQKIMTPYDRLLTKGA
jgi:apoptosis-inducing factor 2